ncbi:NAD(P)-binding protein [Apiospora marii]|uniref:NAD(P)-binding protein n=1 Tax=Apiospora marii TaxID=335849 RepID=A0ABR1R7D9_9PEZI
MPLFELSPFQFFVSQWTPLPYPTTDCTDKVVIVTGGNVGLGLEAARHFVRLNAAKVIIACRSLEKGNAAKADIESTNPTRKGVVEVWQLDLASFESVKDFCRRADQQLDRLDVLLENASVLHTKFFEREGYEEQITVNVLSTFLMALLLLPALRRTATRFNATPHLTIVSSDAHVVTNFRCRHAPAVLQAMRGDDDILSRYGDTKLLQILLARELAEKLDGSSSKKQPRVILNTLNPGLCRTELMRVFARTTEMGSRNLLAAATAPEDTHGKYLSDCKIWDPSRFVRSQDGANVQRRVYAELLEELEKIEPGVTSNI